MKLLYFAWVRETVGLDEETLSLPPGVTTLGDLALWQAGRGAGYAEAFSDPRRLRAAVNQDLATPETPLTASDEVAFFPPLTGG
ncbi:molybdopterin converting factor subunit 1 [Rhodospirillum rubrum]|uniref:Molybdopterin synthase sulfur carrier subunit n=1 Tax=Rhodospirillum rubrum (strain ATCC 11170 / ATH 1.1.1 / DSM 467 / LMG 4362 / NCIMB 8255 / S1) TaxID=269796 RepID=Q2RQI4_RHORT|nr:molybdopterin converting factor subunit 1 [Rhodospirillum rubrum]ABC23611.1 molybdopterin synthase subunit MoaD [Rhodospirillum rubrum ATCC 11170]AEO49349.1 molybdopterin synthase subunit MoaD [Rhodospirillum rubrum F11]MBK5955286.1 molybdopterin synthase sulfur carrier subunit [Rhodospirillum rubrum]QXG79572.1 molybdopterin converting factor subunit 1 [Rhodospirillum rubrum]